MKDDGILKRKELIKELKALFEEAKSEPVTIIAISDKGASWNVRVWLVHPVEDIIAPIANAIEKITSITTAIKRKALDN